MTRPQDAGCFADRIQAEQIAGLSPRRWVAVGPGFSREDVKAVILLSGRGWVGEAVTTLQEIAWKIVVAPSSEGGGKADRRVPAILGAAGRQDLLKLLLSDSRISSRMPELRKLRRQRGFYRKLDRALQMGRMAFSHEPEREVYDERLEQRLGAAARRPVRAELHALARAYEAWMLASRLWDGPLLLRAATERLGASGWPTSLRRPEAIDYFTAQLSESLERDFCDALGREVRWERIGPLEARSAGAGEEGPGGERATRDPARWQRWHTLDDAVERLAEEFGSAASLSEHVVLIPDEPGVRRSLNRALAAAGIPQADPRDPTRLQWDESVKWAFLPLQVVATRFDRATVVAWLRAHQPTPELPVWVREINSRGIRHGLDAYRGGLLSAVHSRIAELGELFGGRLTCSELGRAHLSLVRAAIGTSEAHHGTLAFLERLWDEFETDVARLGQAGRKAPIPYWIERLKARLREAPVPAPALRPADGVQVYRLSQAPLRPAAQLWLLGVPPDWLDGEGAGDYWFNERERETLGAEFAVRSRVQIAEERLAVLRSWIAGSRRVEILDASHGFDGRERESIAPVLRRLGLSTGGDGELAADERGAHPRWAPSYSAVRPVSPLRVELPPAAAGPRADSGTPPEITATALDHYSRCGFQGLAYHRWKLRDSREPGTDPWPEARGTILHLAASRRLASRGPDGTYTLSIEDALARAWAERPPQGLLRSRRLEEHARARMRDALEAFFEKEGEYQRRVNPRTISLDDRELRVRLDDVAIVGKPDRIDETDEGLFIIDYKTSGDLPSGSEMLELGYRLQLPFYALAAGMELARPVLGAQFAELSRGAGRGKGIFFEPRNGKESGKLTNVRSNSRSLLRLDPEVAWSRVRELVTEQARSFISGLFEARPRAARPEEECARCRLSDLCGLRRLAGERAAEREEGPA